MMIGVAAHGVDEIKELFRVQTGDKRRYVYILFTTKNLRLIHFPPHCAVS